MPLPLNPHMHKIATPPQRRARRHSVVLPGVRGIARAKGADLPLRTLFLRQISALQR